MTTIAPCTVPHEITHPESPPVRTRRPPVKERRQGQGSKNGETACETEIRGPPPLSPPPLKKQSWSRRTWLVGSALLSSRTHTRHMWDTPSWAPPPPPSPIIIVTYSTSAASNFGKSPLGLYSLYPVADVGDLCGGHQSIGYVAGVAINRRKSQPLHFLCCHFPKIPLKSLEVWSNYGKNPGRNPRVNGKVTVWWIKEKINKN
ncbi:hypothetical protein ACFX16_004715 [Malus domestica]